MVINRAIVVGAGHNGLVAAYYLAKSGVKVTVFERRDVVGGAAVTEEFHPGFRNSTASYSVGLLSPEVVNEMELTTRFGLKITPKKGGNFMPLSSSEHFTYSFDHDVTMKNIAQLSEKDAKQYDRYSDMLSRLLPLFQAEMINVPPTKTIRSIPSFIRLANKLLKLSTEEQRDLYDLFTRSCGEILDRYFETDALKGLLAFDAVTGNFSSVYAPGSAYVMMHHVMGQLFDKGRWGHAYGGMGAITQAMARACLDTRNVTIVQGKRVNQVTTDANGKATGVMLEDGHQEPADIVLSNIHPSALFLDLASSQESTHKDYYQRIKNYKSGSGSLRMNVALSELPKFTCAPNDSSIYQGSIFFSPSISYIEKAFVDANQIGYARRPVIEMVTPSTYDDSLAPAGKHVASLFCQHMHPSSTSKEEAVNAVIETVTELAPNFRQSIIGMMALSPLDLQERFGLVEGDIFHGQLSLSQLWAARPVLGHGAYDTPIANLYLCGSGAHPGGGVTGYPGRNCAKKVLTSLGL